MAYINGKKVMLGNSVDVIVDAEMQEKTLEITENGETTITPDADKDGLSKVVIKTNVPRDLLDKDDFYTKDETDALFTEVNESIDELAEKVETLTEKEELPDASGDSSGLVLLPNGEIYIKSIDYRFREEPDNTYAVVGLGTYIEPHLEFPSHFNNKLVTAIRTRGAGGSKLLSATIPDSITVIDDYTFIGCKNLQRVNFGDNVASIGKRVFDNCTILKEVVFSCPDNVTEIGEYAFFGCSYLESITLSNKLKAISAGLFDGCMSLKSITIPDSVTEIGDYAFVGCRSLTEIVFPDNVKTIGNNVLVGCSNLQSITIGKNVETIGRVFLSLPNPNDWIIKLVNIRATIPPTLVDYALGSMVSDDCVFTIPEGTLAAYQSAQYWSALANRYTFVEVSE